MKTIGEIDLGQAIYAYNFQDNAICILKVNQINKGGHFTLFSCDIKCDILVKRRRLKCQLVKTKDGLVSASIFPILKYIAQHNPNSIQEIIINTLQYIKIFSASFDNIIKVDKNIKRLI